MLDHLYTTLSSCFPQLLLVLIFSKPPKNQVNHVWNNFAIQILNTFSKEIGVK